MTSHSSQSWTFPGMDYFRPGDSKPQANNNNNNNNNNQRAGNEASAEPSGTTPSRSPSTRSSSHDTKSHRMSRHMDYDEVSETSGVSMSSTKASTGSSPPSSSSNSNGSSQQSAPSLRPSRTTKAASTARPSSIAGAVPARPAVYGLEQEPYRPQLSHSVTAPAYQRPTSMYASNPQQQGIFGSQHGIREAPPAPQPPPPVPSSSSSSSRSVPPLSSNPFSGGAPPAGPNHHLGHHPGVVGMGAQQMMGQQPPVPMHMPGAFPAESSVPYRRPTDMATQLSLSNSNMSMDHFSSDNVWDSEGDTASCLSTSTTATSVMSDMTEKGDTYNITPTQTTSSSRTTTPTHAHPQEQAQPRPAAQTTPRPSILRHATQKSILSNGRKESPSSSSSSAKTASSSHSSKAYPSSSSASSAARGSTSSAPHIHIEVNRSTDPREHHRDDARKRQLVEEALVDKIAQLKLEQSQAKEARSAPAPLKRVPSVRFAEPEKVKVKVEQQKPAAPVASAQEKNLSKELVQQTKEVQKLELEIEKSRLQARERERAELERKVKEEAAEAERRREHERQVNKLQKEKAELEQASKERERAEKEREKADKEREKAAKEREKADKERDKARQKERAQMDKKLGEIERAQREHDRLQESFVDQGRILADLKGRFDAQARALEAAESEREGLQKIKDGFERRCADLSKTLSHVSDKERFVVEQVASLQIIKESLSGRVGPLEARVGEQEGEMRELRGERDGLYRDVKDYLRRITELENGMKGLVEEKHGLMVQLGALEKDKSGLEDQVKDRDGQIRNLTSSLEARARETQQHIASLKDEHKKQMEGLEAAKDALISGLTVGHQLQVQDLEDQIAVLNVHIEGAHADVEKFRESVKSLEGSLDEEKARADEEKAKAGAEQSRADALSSQRDTLQTQLDGHKLLAVDQERDLLDLRIKLTNSEGELGRLREGTRALEAEREELQNRAAALEESKAQPQPAEPAPEEPATAKADVIEVVVEASSPPAPEKPELEARNQELATKAVELEARNAELATQVETTKTELGSRIAQLEGERDAASSALVVAQVELGHTKAIADRVPALEEEAARVPALAADKAALEAKVADLELHAAQVPALRGECARLAEELQAANNLIAALSTAAQHDMGLNGAHIPLPQSPPPPPPSEHPADIPIPPSPSLVGPPPPPPAPERRKVRSRAPSMARSVSSRGSAVSKKSSAGVRDDLALVVVRDSKDRGNITVVRKCDLRAPRPRSRSQGPGKE